MSQKLSRRNFVKLSSMAAFSGGVIGTSKQDGLTKEDMCATFVNPETSEVESEIVTSKDDDSIERIYAGTISGPAGDLVDGVDGKYQSRMYWASEDLLDHNFWIGYASIGPSGKEDGTTGRIHWNRDNFPVNDRLLFHERGHNLRFTHDDGGLMSYDNEPIRTLGLNDTTKSIAEHSDGLHLLDWSGGTDTVLTAIEEWRDGHLTSSDIVYCIDQWRNDTDHFDMYSDGYVKRKLKKADKVSQKVYTGGIYRPENTEDEPNSGTKGWEL